MYASSLIVDILINLLLISGVKASIKYLRIDNVVHEDCGPGKYINLAEIWILKNGTRVMTPDPVMSSNYLSAYWPHYCVDGELGTFCHTDQYPTPWIYLNVTDLDFDSIHIYNRPVQCLDRINDASLWLQTHPDETRGIILQKWSFNRTYTDNTGSLYIFPVRFPSKTAPELTPIPTPAPGLPSPQSYPAPQRLRSRFRRINKKIKRLTVGVEVD